MITGGNTIITSAHLLRGYFAGLITLTNAGKLFLKKEFPKHSQKIR